MKHEVRVSSWPATPRRVAVRTITGCSCGWTPPSGTTDPDEAFAAHVALASVPVTHFGNVQEQARELAEARVHALLQTFAMEGVDEDMIEKLLQDAIASTFTSGFASGWDAALDQSRDAVGKVPRFRPEPGDYAL